MKFEKDFSIAYSQKRSEIWKSVETVLITLLLIYLARIVRPNDPFSLTGPIPWLCFVPVFCSLFYGAIYGISSLIILLISLLLLQPMNELNSLILREYIVGSISLTLLVGVFSSYWNSRIRQVEHLNNYVREHLEDLSRDYYLLRISHERIEQAYIIKPLSLREAFYQIKQDMVKSNYEINSNNSQMLLGIFSQYCSLNSAAFCLYNEMQQINTIAFLGVEFPVSASDPLIQNAIKKKATTYFAVNKLVDSDQSEYIAIIPLLNTQRTMIGFVVIRNMPFWSLTHDNLEVLSVIAAYFALQWSTIRKVAHLLKIFPTCPSEFLDEFQTLVSLKKHNNVDSALSCIIVPPGAQQQNIVYTLEQQKRSLDYLWVFSVKSVKLVITLMPLTSIEGVFGYKRRIAALLKGEFSRVLNTEGLNFRFQQVNQQGVSKQLNDFIKEATDAIE